MICPQPIRVRLGTERVQIMCAACEYRTPLVADYRTAGQQFDTDHPAPRSAVEVPQ